MLSLDREVRADLWKRVAEVIEGHFCGVEHLRVTPETDVAEIRSRLSTIDFDIPLVPAEAFDFAVKNLTEFQVHTTHPRYFGLFNPAPTPMSIVADVLVAAFNPQIAAWSHSPFAAEVERHLINAFALRFGYHAAEADGTFCSGGAEANHTALIAALVRKFPDFAERGVRSLERQPVLYVSTESHHSIAKAARFCGLGTHAVREIETDDGLKMNLGRLAEQITRDHTDGFEPFFVVATAGTTNTGTIDDISEIAAIAEGENLWLHVDAAWGGAAAFVPELKEHLIGIERADSITFDAHKWLSVPMAAGIFLTRHAEILAQACSMATAYMPRDAGAHGVHDPFAHSMQWSRRFIGLKVFLSLAVAGWEGYADAIRHQTEMGELLRRELENEDWQIVNKTSLPVVCFRDPTVSSDDQGKYHNNIADRLVASGEAWLSTTILANATPVLRACITNFRTQEKDVQHLVELLGRIRSA